jgi:hypothetical protein
MTEENSPIPRKRRSAARIAGVVTGAVASLIAVGLVALGAVALWANSEKSDDGYLSTDTQRFGAGSRALATENLDVNLDGGEWILDSSDLGDVRLEVASQNDKPVFVGIARTDEVSSYLRNVAHSTVTDIDSDPFEAKYSAVGGERKPVAPAEAGIWAASTHGRGIQTLNWEIEDGDWSVVVMNEDGSPGVYADISAGANIPFLDELGWTSMGSGALLFVAAVGLVVLSVRPPRSGPGQPAGPAVAPAAA